MSLTLPTWLQALQTVGLAFLQLDPATAGIASFITEMMMAVENLPGASGAQKLGLVVPIAVNGANIAKALGANVDPAAIQAGAASAISTAVLIANIVSGVKTPAAAVAAQSTSVA